MKKIQATHIDLNLGGQSAGADQNRHPRHILHFQGCVLAYGGDTGVLTAISLDSLRNGKENVDGASRSAFVARVIARFDDPIRSVAISPDNGQRIAFGFDDGSTRIYSFPSSSPASSTTANTAIHPLIKHIFDDSSNDGDTTFFSQCDGGEADQLSSFIAGPRFEAPIRCLSFHPLSSQSRGYFLAVASEASPGFSILRIPQKQNSNTSSLTMEEEEDFKTYLRDEGNEAHDSSGLRTLTFSPFSSTQALKETFLSTLGMDGRMCLWNVTSLEDPGFLWELLSRDAFKVVRNTDIGEWNGSAVADRIYSPVWADGFTAKDSMDEDSSLLVLGLPGACDVQLRIQSKTTKEWTKKNYWLTTTSSEGHSDDIVTLAFEPMNLDELRCDEGRLLVTCGRDGIVCVWEVYNQIPLFKNGADEFETASRQDIGRFIQRIDLSDSNPPSTNLVTKIMWFVDESGEKILCLATDDGTMKCLIGKDTLTKLRNPVDVTKVASTTSVSMNGTVADSSYEKSTTKRFKKMKNEVDDDDSTVSAQTFGHESILEAPVIKDHDAIIGRKAFVDDEADEGPDDEISYDDYLKKDDAPPSDDAEPKEDNVDAAEEECSTYDDEYNNNLQRKNFSSIPEAQAAFAPSSTPLGFKRRILCWNYKGIITTREDDTGRRDIDISFTDVISSRPVSFRDNMDFIFGSLGEDGAIFSSDLMEDDFLDDEVKNTVDELAFLSDATKSALRRSGRSKRIGGNNYSFTGSCIFFYRFETYGSVKDKDWQISLPSGERALGCACGEGWAGVVTKYVLYFALLFSFVSTICLSVFMLVFELIYSRRFLRMFTSSGLQGPVIWLKGDPVVIVGRGQFVGIICHESNPLTDGTQKLAFTIYDAVNYKFIASGPVAAISPSGSLTWAGFSNDFSLMIKDSEGILSMLSCHDPDNSSHWLWTPILDTNNHKKERDDLFWPVSVETGKLTALHLRGGDKHPDPIRRPITISLDLYLPLVGSMSDSE